MIRAEYILIDGCSFNLRTQAVGDKKIIDPPSGVAGPCMNRKKKNAADSSAASVSGAQSATFAAASVAEKTARMLTDEDVEQFGGIRPGLLLYEASEMVGPDYVNESDPTKSASLYNDHVPIFGGRDHASAGGTGIPGLDAHSFGIVVWIAAGIHKQFVGRFQRPLIRHAQSFFSSR